MGKENMRHGDDGSQLGQSNRVAENIALLALFLAPLMGFLGQMGAWPDSVTSTAERIYIVVQWLVFPIGAWLLPVALGYSWKPLLRKWKGRSDDAGGEKSIRVSLFASNVALLVLTALAFSPGVASFLVVVAFIVGATSSFIMSVAIAVVATASLNLYRIFPWSHENWERLLSHDVWYVAGSLAQVLAPTIIFYLLGLGYRVIDGRWRRC